MASTQAGGLRDAPEWCCTNCTEFGALYVQLHPSCIATFSKLGGHNHNRSARVHLKLSPLCSALRECDGNGEVLNLNEQV